MADTPQSFFNQTHASDFAILYDNPENLKPIKLVPGEKTGHKCGTFFHDDIIGKPFGTKLQGERGFVYILGPSAELWTRSLNHRTQILYRPDISMIIGNLDIKPGDIVVESGTGSGSLSTSIARAIMPTGRLYTFEFNAARAQTAQAEFEENRLPITCEHRDVVANGFRHADFERADALFLDIPNPWDAIVQVGEVLKVGGFFANFSPCIEQVQKCCLELSERGFSNVRTYETLSRPFHHVDMKGLHGSVKGHTGYLTFAVYTNNN